MGMKKPQAARRRIGQHSWDLNPHNQLRNYDTKLTVLVLERPDKYRSRAPPAKPCKFI